MKSLVFLFSIVLAGLVLPAFAQQYQYPAPCVIPGFTKAFPYSPGVGGVSDLNNVGFRYFSPAANPATLIVGPWADMSNKRGVAPGEVVSLVGQAFSLNVTAVTSGVPWSAELGGTSLLANGKSAPLYHLGIRRDQMSLLVNSEMVAQIPFDLQPDANGNIELAVVETIGGSKCLATFSPWKVPLVKTAAAIATSLADGSLLLQDAVSGVVVNNDHPLKSGYLAIWAYGLGKLVSPVEAGQPVPGMNAATTSVSLTVGGNNATVMYAGAAPTYIGLDVIIAQIPAGNGGTAELKVDGQSVIKFPLPITQ